MGLKVAISSREALGGQRVAKRSWLCVVQVLSCPMLLGARPALQETIPAGEVR